MNKFLFVLFLILSISAKAQVKNVNPDPNGEPWLVGGWKNPTDEEQLKIDEIKLAKMPVYRTKTVLPSRLDNSTLKYFRPVFTQIDGCCAQASGVAYNFTYEMNRSRNTSANTFENQFPTHFTYNFLNDGSGDNGSTYFDGWAIIKENGCPTVANYGNGLATYGPKAWVSGFDIYQSALENRVDEVLAFDVSTPEGLEVLKTWMYDHLDGASDGGIANFAAGVSDNGFRMKDSIIIRWGSEVNHAMTFVGWDDEVEYDFNNDGKITTTQDINSDGKVDMRDWEKGALIMVNSWGSGWGIAGKAYVMYKLLAESTQTGGIQSGKAYSIRVKSDNFSPKLVLRAKISHANRSNLKLLAGVATDLNATEPEHEIQFPLFNNQGGNYSMQGLNDDALELALDISSLLSYVNSESEAKYFLKIIETDEYSQNAGVIESFSVYDYQNELEYTSETTQFAILDNSESLLSAVAEIPYSAPSITTDNLMEAIPNHFYSSQLEADGGQAPYEWSLLINYNRVENQDNFPTATTALNPTDNDDGYAVLNLDFEFPFYNTKSNKIVVNTDGSLIFLEEFNYLRNEQAIIDNKMLAVFASDLMIYPEIGDGIFYSGDEKSAVIRWKTSLYDNQAANVDVAIKLFPSGEIQFFYGENITAGLDWAAGISNGEGINYLLASGLDKNNPSGQKLGFQPTDYPQGMSISKEGVFSGFAGEEFKNWDLVFRVTDYNNISKTKQISFSSGELSSINELEKNKISVYPNPTENQLNFDFVLDNRSSVSIELFNLLGQKKAILLNDKLASGSHQLNYAISQSLQKGIYICKITINGKSLNQRVIVE